MANKRRDKALAKIGKPKPKAVRTKKSAPAAAPVAPAVATPTPPATDQSQPETTPAVWVSRPYAVMLDGQNVAYLRVKITPGGAQYVTQHDSRIDLITMDKATAKSRAMAEVPGASVLDSVKIFLKPLTAGVTITERAKKELEIINKDEEFITMANAKKKATKSAKKAAAKGAAPKKAAKTSKGASKARFAGKTITVVKKEHGAREGTKRAKAMEILFKAKTTDMAIPQLEKIGADNSFIRFAVEQGFIKLA